MSTASRRVAYDTIRATSESEAYANLLLPHAIARAGLDAADAALATELTYGTLRRRGTYDAIVAIAADRDTATIDPAVLDALRLGVHQLLSTRIASHAAVNETVGIVRDTVSRGAAGFVNAVLRRVARDTPGAWLDRAEETARSDDERLSVRTSHPVWVIRAFRRALAAEGRADELEALLEADNVAPQVTMAALPGLADVPSHGRTAYSPIGFRAERGDPEGAIRASGGVLRVQDEGSQLVALALAGAGTTREGERWLDLCAGPGGKTAVLAAVARGTGATLDANEISPSRADLVRDSVAGVPLDVHVAELDGRDFVAAHPQSYDRILVDAPCTGLGALRRRPEARWRKAPGDVPELVALQTTLVDGAIDALRPGGVLAYVTCSPHLAETTGVVEDLLRRRPDVRELDARAAIRAVARTDIDLAAPLSGGGRAQLWPHRHGTDAMFLALLERTG